MWRQLIATVERAHAEPVSDWMLAEGALSVTFEDGLEQPLFEPPLGETPLWDQTRVIALFDATPDDSLIAIKARAFFGEQLLSLTSENLEDQVWERAWMAHFKPMCFGQRLWICPTGFEPPEPQAVNVILDPGLAFGTGTHPTTALCLAWLDGLDLEGQRVLDYGCGSGILAIAALRLGASSAMGVDIDPQALTASLDNAEKNGVANRLRLGLPDAPRGAPSGVVLANILAGPLVALRGDILGTLRVGGLMALSGILREQAAEICAAYDAWIDFDPAKYQEDWVLLTGRKRSQPLKPQVD
ncbi:MAG: 50S ribosomal protein L11 methyltransferase [Methylococcus sp.]